MSRLRPRRRCNEYCEQLDDAAPTGDVPVADPFWELHNLTEDPDERSNVVEQHPYSFFELREVLSNERSTKRLAHQFRNAAV